MCMFGEGGEVNGDLHDEEPAPSCYAVQAVHACEDAGGDEAREPRGEDLSAVQDCNARCYFCGGVSDGLMEDQGVSTLPFRV